MFETEMKDFTDQEKLMFQSEYDGNKKTTAKSILFGIFLGQWGGHHFYLGRRDIGFLYIAAWAAMVCGAITGPELFSVLGLIVIYLVVIVDLFFLSGRTKGYNSDLAEQIIVRIKAAR